MREKRVYFANDGNGRPRIKKFQFEETGLAPMTWQDAAKFSDNQQAKKENLDLFKGDDAFGTPKPEKLLKNIIHIATNPGDLILDSFLGSGATAAVAHKMGRRYIGIEMGDHAVTHCAPRLKKVIEGEQGGISEAPAPSLIEIAEKRAQQSQGDRLNEVQWRRAMRRLTELHAWCAEFGPGSGCR